MCDLCIKFENDRPFRFHRTDSNTKGVLVGRIANQYIEIFENQIYPHAMVNSLMTAVIGRPGAGKTQILNYLAHISNENKNRACSILELKDKELDYSSLLNHLFNDESITQYFSSHGYDLNNINDDDEKLIIMKNAIEYIHKETKNNKVGVCLLVDAVDEYLRKIHSFKGKERKEIVEDILGTMMVLLNDLPRLCIVFAITRDVKEVFDTALKEISPGRRFSFINDENGNPLDLDNFDEDEAEDMVWEFLDVWSKRNGTLPAYHETETKDGKNIFPFTPKALNLFWRAGDVPGDISTACLIALNKKIISNSECNIDESHLIVTESDAALIIKQFSNYFLNYENDKLKNEIDSLLDSKQIEQELNKISLKAKYIYSDCSQNLVDAFKTYLLDLHSAFQYEYGNTNLLIRNKYNITEKFEMLDLIINYKRKKIGVQIISKLESCHSGSFERKLHEKTYALCQSLVNKQVDNGLIILISETYNPELSNHISDKIRLWSERAKSKCHVGNKVLDYSATIQSYNLLEKNAWYISGLNVLETNGDEKIRYTQHLDKKLNFQKIFDELIKLNPAVSSYGTISGVIMDKAE